MLLITGHREEKRSYHQSLHSSVLKAFKNATYVGNYLTGFAISVKVEGTTSWVLTPDRCHVQSYVMSRKSLKLGFVR